MIYLCYMKEFEMTPGRYVRETREEDLERVMELFDQGRGIMRSTGNLSQWTDGYPSRDAVLRDMENHSSYVMEENGLLIATFALVEGIEPTYLKIYEGSWLDAGSPYATIHRLASGPESHGIARDCFGWAWNRINNLRIDTHRDNCIMRKCVEAAGFRYCGIIYLANGDERLAYQKINV